MSGHEAAVSDVTLVPPQSEREREREYAKVHQITACSSYTAVSHAAHRPVYSSPACGTPPSVQRSCMHSVYDGPHSLPVEARLIHEVPHNDISVLQYKTIGILVLY